MTLIWKENKMNQNTLMYCRFQCCLLLCVYKKKH